LMTAMQRSLASERMWARLIGALPSRMSFAVVKDSRCNFGSVKVSAPKRPSETQLTPQLARIVVRAAVLYEVYTKCYMCDSVSAFRPKAVGSDCGWRVCEAWSSLHVLEPPRSVGHRLALSLVQLWL